MNGLTVLAPEWYRALTLTERLASWRDVPPLPPGQGNTGRAERILGRWRTQAPFDKEDLFLRRLNLDGITEEQLRHVLSEPAEILRDRSQPPPDWLRQLIDAFSDRPEEQLRGLSLGAFLARAPNLNSQSGFLFLIEPLIDDALNRLRAGIRTITEEHRTIPFDLQNIERSLLVTLSEPSLNMMMRTLVLELNIARLQGQLSGETPEARFNSFVERLRGREQALSLLEEYPALARQLTVRIGYWTDYVLEFLRHLSRDWEAIQSRFGADRELGVLSEISGGVGDSHRGGRAVMIAKFTSGFKIVYKPKSLTVDIHFQRLLEWLNERGDHPPFRTLEVLDCGKYGWVEFVEAQSCSSAEEIERFYRRQGAYLALLYALQATDFHLENLIAAGEHPVLVDLESLLIPRMATGSNQGADSLADDRLFHSVLRTGLLPQQIWINEEGEGLDLSGLGGAPGQLTPFKAATWEATGTDQMKITRQRVVLPAGQNRPSLNGAEVKLLDYSEALIAGFTSLYQTLRHHREELLAESGPLSCFTGDEIRIILRPSKIYAQLLQESYHPDLLGEGLDRERHFDRLWVGVEPWPELARAVAAERRDLQNGDIPMFTNYIGANDLWASNGVRIPDWFKESGLDSSRRLISEMGEEDLQRQSWIIRASLTSLSPEALHSSGSLYSLAEPQSQADRASLLGAARRIGDRLEQIAVRGPAQASWLGLTAVSERNWNLAPLGLDLYDGLPGVMLFLAYLGEGTGEDRYTVLARAAFNAFQQRLERARSSLISIGGFSGWGGIIYSLMHLGALWRDRALIDQAEDLILAVPDLIEKDRDYDLIAGSAGCLGALVAFYHYTGSPRSLAAAIECGEFLVSSSRTMPVGIGWEGRSVKGIALAGFAHGNAGFAWALLHLASLTGNERYRVAALEAMNYERSLFSPVRGWPDLRKFDSSRSDSQAPSGNPLAAWCHGAAGIGLGRLGALAWSDDQETRMEIQAALELTLARGFGQNHSLCHGDLGNIDLLLQAQAVLGDQGLRPQIERLSAIILESIERQGACCGVPLGIETPGLMTGLAGIGYGLLRLAEPSRFPSVLTLAPPFRTA